MNHRSIGKPGRYTAPKRNFRRQAASAALAVGTSVGIATMAAPMVAGASTSPLVSGNAHMWTGHPLSPPTGPSSGTGGKGGDNDKPKPTTTIDPNTTTTVKGHDDGGDDDETCKSDPDGATETHSDADDCTTG
ncbi:MAG: hypothetical protein WCL38_07950, partial [Actinomycetota bacterium]